MCACGAHKIDYSDRLRSNCRDDVHCKPPHNGWVGGGADSADVELGKALADVKPSLHDSSLASGDLCHFEHIALVEEGLAHCSWMQGLRQA